MITLGCMCYTQALKNGFMTMCVTQTYNTTLSVVNYGQREKMPVLDQYTTREVLNYAT